MPSLAVAAPSVVAVFQWLCTEKQTHAGPVTPQTQPLRRSNSLPKPPVGAGTPKGPSNDMATPAALSVVARSLTQSIDQICGFDRVPTLAQWQGIQKNLKDMQSKLGQFK